MKQNNALISVFNKDGIVEFAQQLKEMGWNIYSSGGTAKALNSAGVETIDVAILVGGGPILGHKVVTLSRELMAGLLADPNDESEMKQMMDLQLPIIDLVCVDCYPLAEEIGKADCTEASVTEKTDIGGPTMLRAGAKGRRIVICNPAHRQDVINWLIEGKPAESGFLTFLAAKAEEYVAEYVGLSADYLRSLSK